MEYDFLKVDDCTAHKARKATNGRGWSDYRIAQEKRQKEINQIAYEKEPNKIDLIPILFWFTIICILVYVLTLKV